MHQFTRTTPRGISDAMAPSLCARVRLRKVGLLPKRPDGSMCFWGLAMGLSFVYAKTAYYNKSWVSLKRQSKNKAQHDQPDRRWTNYVDNTCDGRTSLVVQFITLSVYLCTQLDAREAARRAGPSATVTDNWWQIQQQTSRLCNAHVMLDCCEP